MPYIHEELPAVVEEYFELYSLYEQEVGDNKYEWQRTAHQIEGGELASHIGGEVMRYTRFSGGKDSFTVESETFSGVAHVFDVIEACARPAGPRLLVKALEMTDCEQETGVEQALLKRDTLRWLKPYEKRALIYDLRMATADLLPIVDAMTLEPVSRGNGNAAETSSAEETAATAGNETLGFDTSEKLKQHIKNATHGARGEIVIFNDPIAQTLKGIETLVTPDGVYWAERDAEIFLIHGENHEPADFVSATLPVDDVNKVIEERDFVPGGEELAAAFFEELDAITAQNKGLTYNINPVQR